MNNMTMHIRQTEVAAGVAECEAFVVEAQQMQNRGMQVVHVNSLFDRIPAEFISGTVYIAALDATASQPHGETIVVVIATTAD